jgi:hypothetical protein
MTRAQRKKILYQAAELIATGNERASCLAISVSEGWNRDSANSLKSQYCRFWDKDPKEFWFDAWETKVLLSVRILLLLWFAEVGLEGIEKNKEKL